MNRSFEYQGIKYYVEKQEQCFFLYVWYESQKILSEPIEKEKIEYLATIIKTGIVSSEYINMSKKYVFALFKRAMEGIERKINQIKINQILYKADMERKECEQKEYDRIWKKSVSK